MGLRLSRIKDMLNKRTIIERANLSILPANHPAPEVIPPRASLTLETEAPAQPEVVAESIAPQLFQLTAGDGEDPTFRRLTQMATLRDLNPMMHDRMQAVCYFLRVTTPFGKRIVEIITSYTVGKGVRVTAKDPAVQEVIERFWKRNKMDTATREWCDELTTFGELCLPFAVNRVNGDVRLGYIDPLNVDGIQFAAITTEQGDVPITQPWGVRVRSGPMGAPAQIRSLKIVQEVDDPYDQNYGTLDGQCFYFAINKPKSASRGFSELFSLADWIDVFDQMVFDFADRVRFLNAFLYHYTIEGADAKQLNEFKDQLTKNPPKQGGVQVTNEKVKIEPKTPSLGGADMSEASRVVKLYGLGGAGLPAWFFADPVDANRSTAAEMQGPTGKKILDRQNSLVECVTEVLNFVLDAAVKAGVLGQNVDRSFSIEMPELEARDIKSGAQMLTGATASLAQAVDEGWIRNETGARAYHTLLSEIGTDIEDSSAEYKLAQEEAEERSRAQQNALLPQSNLAAALAGLPPGTTPPITPGAGVPDNQEDDELEAEVA